MARSSWTTESLILCYVSNGTAFLVASLVLPPVGLFEIQGLFRTKCYYACSMVWYCGELNHNSHARLGSAMNYLDHRVLVVKNVATKTSISSMYRRM